MTDRKWSLGTASAGVRGDGDVLCVRVTGLVTAAVIDALALRLLALAHQQRSIGFVLVLGLGAILGRGAGEACLRSMLGAQHLPCALVVPPERLPWAATHCRQLSEYGLFRHAFEGYAPAVAWVRQIAPLLQDVGAPGSARAGGPGTAPASPRPRTPPAGRQTRAQAAAQGSSPTL
jgi:hypothetical protein